MQKILFVLPSLAVGGYEKALVTLVNKLSRLDYEIDVLTWNPKDNLKEDLNEKVRHRYKASDEHFGNYIPYIKYKYYDGDMWDRRATPTQMYQYYVGKKTYDIEIAFFHDPKTVGIVSGSTNEQSVKIAWIHIDFSKDRRIKELFETDEGAQQRYFDTFSSFDKVVCVSRQSYHAFVETVGDTGNLKIIYNILPVEEIRKKASEKPLIDLPKAKLNLVMIGRLVDKVKGQKRLIRVVGQLRHEGCDINLALIGTGEDEEELIDYIDELSLSENIIITGVQMNPYPFIKGADVLVCSSYEEGYNLTVAEALILGTPVLSTDCTGPNEILDYGKFGFIVENSDEGLYLGIKYLYESPEMLEYYRITAKQRLSFFDENRILREVTDLFEPTLHTLHDGHGPAPASEKEE